MRARALPTCALTLLAVAAPALAAPPSAPPAAAAQQPSGSETAASPARRASGPSRAAPASTAPAPAPTAAVGADLPSTPSGAPPPASPAGGAAEVAPDDSRENAADRPAAPAKRRPSSPPATATEEPTPQDATDTLGGHLVVALRGGLQAPLQLGRRSDWADRAPTGPGVGIDLALGISRHVALGVRASHAWFGDSTGSLEGGGLTGGGALLRYHLSQGVRFDPWLAVSLGLASRAPSTGPSLVLAEAVRFELGGDWYATRGVGLGPLLAGALMTPLSDRSGEPRQLSGLVELSLRLVVDRPGK